MKKKHRRSIRLKGYDYSQLGAYFITICTREKERLLGDIADGEMHLNNAGQMIQSVWNELPQHYPGIDVDAFVVMPNHIHGIIILTSVGATPCGCPLVGQALNRTGAGQARGPAPTMSLPDIVHRFKSLTATFYRHDVAENNWHPSPNRLWQRNYYEHIIRNSKELNNIRQYVINNALRWQLDRENPLSTNYNLELKRYFDGIYVTKIH